MTTGPFSHLSGHPTLDAQGLYTSDLRGPSVACLWGFLIPLVGPRRRCSFARILPFFLKDGGLVAGGVAHEMDACWCHHTADQPVFVITSSDLRMHGALLS